MRPESQGLLVTARDVARYVISDTAGVAFEGSVSGQRLRQSVLYSFMVIGEALSRLRRRDEDLARTIADIHEVVAMRNVLIHGYDVTDYDIVWRAIKEKLPVLVLQVEGTDDAQRSARRAAQTAQELDQLLGR